MYLDVDKIEALMWSNLVMHEIGRVFYRECLLPAIREELEEGQVSTYYGIRTSLKWVITRHLVSTGDGRGERRVVSRSKDEFLRELDEHDVLEKVDWKTIALVTESS